MLLRFAISRSVAVPVDRIVVAERHGNAPAILNGRCRDLSFSLSHARQWIACAIGFGCKLGVDIEAIDPARDLQSISEIVFHPEDRRWLAQQESKDFVPEFYRLWCTREAALKLHSGACENALPLIGRSEWHSYSSAVKAGFITVICSNKRLKTVQQVEVQNISLAAVPDQVACRTARVSAKSRGSKVVVKTCTTTWDPALVFEKTGATRRTRTGDLLITNQLLYQLS
jgi:4'-phosphopantetheinyl transferase superfamily